VKNEYYNLRSKGKKKWEGEEYGRHLDYNIMGNL
jgi:hypothetical protein